MTKGVFDAQIEFIREAGIPVAPIYLLTALKWNGHVRALPKRENRLIDVPHRKQCRRHSISETEMDRRDPDRGIHAGDRHPLRSRRSRTTWSAAWPCSENLEFVPHLYKPKSRNAVFADLMGVRNRLSDPADPRLHEIHRQGLQGSSPPLLPMAVRLAAMGYHFEKITRQQNTIRGRSWSS